jgi:hypothetical protein
MPGETALGYACSWGHLGVVKLLVDAGVDVNAVEHDPEDAFRNTALDCCSQQPEIGAFLRSVGAKRLAEMEGGAERWIEADERRHGETPPSNPGWSTDVGTHQRRSLVTLSYISGEHIEAGDRIRYHGDAGHVEFVATARTGDPAQDWFITEFPGGGVMIWAEGFGSVFLESDGIDDFLEFVSRAPSPG